jgi:hypothetical protein
LFRKFREFKSGEQICFGGDCSTGAGDKSAGQFYSKTFFDYPLVWSDYKIATDMTNAIFPELEKIADITGNKPLVAYERNNGGWAEMERLASMNRLGKYVLFVMPGLGTIEGGSGVRYGYETNSATRPELLQTLKDSIDNQVDKIYDEETIKEMFSFVKVQTSSSWRAQHEKNAHDDLLFAAAIAKKISEYADAYPLKTAKQIVQVATPDFQNKNRWGRLRREL